MVFTEKVIPADKRHSSMNELRISPSGLHYILSVYEADLLSVGKEKLASQLNFISIT